MLTPKGSSTRRTFLAALIEKLLPQLSLEAGVTNLTDKNDEPGYGFPNPGRTGFANANHRF